LNDLKIKKTSSVAIHSLLLSCDGDIYAFGMNECGRVGNGTQENQRFPIKLELNKKFIDISSHPDHDISIPQSIDGIYYVWGYFENKKVLSPQSTKYKSFEDILSSHNFINNRKEDILISNMFIVNIKTFEKLIEFNYSFVKNGFYSKYFKEIKPFGCGSFGSVFKV
jgi:alpha-tubulin suppressor-like RCC1 family protein